MGISARHWMVVWRWRGGRAKGPEIPTNEIATMSVKLPYILHGQLSHSVQLICTSYVT